MIYVVTRATLYTACDKHVNHVICKQSVSLLFSGRCVCHKMQFHDKLQNVTFTVSVYPHTVVYKELNYIYSFLALVFSQSSLVLNVDSMVPITPSNDNDVSKNGIPIIIGVITGLGIVVAGLMIFVVCLAVWKVKKSKGLYKHGEGNNLS